MKFKILLSAFSAIAIISSCSTAYKNSQTPDDVYYSPASGTEKYISREKETYTRRYDTEERQIRMRVYDYRWRSLDYDYDYGCSYSPYYYGYNHGYYYNPYYYPVPVYNYGPVVNPKNNTPRMTNLSSYQNHVAVKNSKSGYRTTPVNSARVYNNNTSSNSEYSRRIIRPQSNNDGYQPSRDNNTRTYNPSSSSSSSSSSGSSSSGGTSVSRPSRGN